MASHMGYAMHNETFKEGSSGSICIPLKFWTYVMRTVLCNRSKVLLITLWQVFPLSHRICQLMAQLTPSFLGEKKYFLVKQNTIWQYLRKIVSLDKENTLDFFLHHSLFCSYSVESSRSFKEHLNHYKTDRKKIVFLFLLVTILSSL